MHFRVRYTSEAAAVIRNLPPGPKAAIHRGIDQLIKDPSLGKELQAEFAGFQSHRVRRHRLIYQVNEAGAWIEVYYVGPRRGVYEVFAELLQQRDEG